MKKKIKNFIFTTFLIAISFASYGKNVTVTFKIYAGKCSYSKSTIKSVIKEAGGKHVNYNFKTQMVEFTFDNEAIDIMDIHKKIAGAGFQTQAVEPTDHDYKMLPDCAKYKRI